MYDYEQRLTVAQNAIRDADHVLIGAGAGLSAVAGLTYSGKRFTDNFGDFIEKYGVEDMYAASFYLFPTQEELWAHWARHIDVNRYLQGPTPLYQNILRLVGGKDSFVITTNVESQFEKAGFPQEKIFEVQGNYADTVGKNEKTIAEYIKNQLQEDITSDQISLKEYMNPFADSKNTKA